MKIRLLKLFDAVVRRILLSVIPLPEKSKGLPATLVSVLIIRPGGIGDAVLLAPMIEYIRKYFTAIQITVLAEKRNAGVFSLIQGVDKLLCYDRPGEFLQLVGPLTKVPKSPLPPGGGGLGWGGDCHEISQSHFHPPPNPLPSREGESITNGFARGSVSSHYDVVIDTEQWHGLSAVVSRFVSAPIKIGFDTNGRRRMFTDLVPYSHDDYEAESFIHLIKPLGIEAEFVEMEAPYLSVPDDAASKVCGLLEPFHNAPFVAIFPGASIKERRWGADNFRQVAKMLSAFGVRIVVLGGKEDREQGEIITGGGLGLNLAGLTTLSETAAVIQKSSLLLSGDSGILHIAVGLNIPTVSLFGPGRSKKWAPRGDRHIVLNKELSCSPCTKFGNTPPCPIKVKCMRDISADEVVNAVTILLTTVGAMPSHCCKRDWIEVAD